jgi:hypothetical protein
MNILFIVGSADLGTDGVGDYTRSLAAALNKIGHTCSIIATHDRHVTEVVEEKQLQGDILVSVFRIPKIVTEGLRRHEIVAVLSRKKYDWISLQYVPYSYNKRGLPFKFIYDISRILEGYQVHVMFHELWKGMAEEDRWIDVSIGKVQRIVISYLIKKIKPTVVHSHSVVYLFLLKKFYSEAQRLPLFSSIPLTSDKPRSGFIGELRFVIFGSIFPHHNYLSFFTELKDYAEKNSKFILIQFLGGNGNHKSNVLGLLDAISSNNLRTEDLGRRSSDFISSVLSSAHFGITSFPYLLTEKSSSIATYMEHKLPTICVSDSWNIRYQIPPFIIDGVWQYEVGGLNTILEGIAKGEVNCYSSLAVAERLMENLKNIENG